MCMVLVVYLVLIARVLLKIGSKVRNRTGQATEQGAAPMRETAIAARRTARVSLLPRELNLTTTHPITVEEVTEDY